MPEEIIINADGTITRRNVTSSNHGNSNNRGSSNDSGWIWIAIIVVCFIVGVIYVINSNSNKATYLSVSKSRVTFNWQGGSTDIEIDTDGDWEIGSKPENWGHVSKNNTSVTLSIDNYSGDEDRTDWFSIQAGDYEKRIEIVQRANREPSANIEKVWVDHNVFVNGYKGMLIHIKFTTKNLLRKTVYVYAFFYQSDNQTPLHNQYGKPLYFYGTGIPNYKSARFDDFTLFVPHEGLNMAPGVNGSFSFDIEVKDSRGTLLDNDKNTTFTFSSGG